jgi:hypothetical protein
MSLADIPATQPIAFIESTHFYALQCGLGAGATVPGFF